MVSSPVQLDKMVLDGEQPYKQRPTYQPSDGAQLSEAGACHSATPAYRTAASVFIRYGAHASNPTAILNCGFLMAYPYF